jgi:hypothetical protein
MSSVPTIPSVVAQSLLPCFTYEQADAILTSRSHYSEHEKMVLYTHYLVARGHFGDLTDYLDRLDSAERRSIVDDALYDTYWGNTLHTCAYWNTGEGALAIYRYLDAAGARPTRDYYGDFPWEAGGIVYACPLRGLNVTDGNNRDNDEFTETHADIQRYFGHYVTESEDERPDTPIVAPDASDLPLPPLEWSWGPSVCVAGGAGASSLQASCSLHRPGAPYSRNSDGYYGSYAPACNGCPRGNSDEEECELADEVRRQTRSLLSIWSTCYTEYTAADAADLSVELLRAMNRLNERTTVVVTPQDYAERVVHMCNAAIALDFAIKNNGTPGERALAVRAALENFFAVGSLDRRVLGDVERYPIVAAARTLLIPRT